MHSKMALITFMESGGAGPDNTLPGGQPGYPSQGLPPGAVQLPVYPFDPTVPDHTLPGAPVPGQPLPVPPPVRPSQPIAPGGHFIVKWFACHGLILVPDHTLPPTPEPK
jgi:hypothetical protein